MPVSVKDGGFFVFWSWIAPIMKHIYYHIHHQSYQEDLPFWLDLTEGCGPVLELGCGTGRVAIPLGEAGRKVWGLDLDPEMLDIARQELKKRAQTVQDRVRFIDMDMTSFQLDHVFEIVLSPCNTYSLFDKEKRMAILQRVVDHIQEDGAFSASVPNPHRLAELIASGEDEEEGEDAVVEEIFTHPLTGDPVQVSSRVEPTAEGVRWIWYYDHLHPDGGIEREEVSRHHLYTPVDQYRAELETWGFSTLIYGDFLKTPFSEESPYLIIVGEM
ncbi:MAG: class I SAM-dependent methyltransferase [Chloroflexota bacterium]